MANVYRAYDPSINRVLAIKVLKREFCRDADCAKRFVREAKAAGALLVQHEERHLFATRAGRRSVCDTQR